MKITAYYVFHFQETTSKIRFISQCLHTYQIDLILFVKIYVVITLLYIVSPNHLVK